MGTNIHRVLIFAWVLLLIDSKKLMGTYIHGVLIHRLLVIDGYLYCRVYNTVTDSLLSIVGHTLTCTLSHFADI